MHDALVISQIILWIAVAALSAIVLALIRQIGVLHERIAPMGALTIDKGPSVGDKSPVFELADLANRRIAIGAARTDGRSQLLMFVSPTCPVCKRLIPMAKSLATAESRWLDLIFTSDGEPSEQDEFIARHRLESYPFVLSPEVGMTYRISKLPYAVLIDEEGVVRAKGLVNTREHLESIVAAKQMQVASIQEYLKMQRERGADTLAGGERGAKHHG
jgi:methylamine dehydrogenase accessory protein MauD